MAASHAIEWKLLDHAAEAPVAVGDLVSSDAGGMPIYRVVGLERGRAWLGAGAAAPGARLMSLDGFRWRARPNASRGPLAQSPARDRTMPEDLQAWGFSQR
jgi:hypothetical protein